MRSMRWWPCQRPRVREDVPRPEWSRLSRGRTRRAPLDIGGPPSEPRRSLVSARLSGGGRDVARPVGVELRAGERSPPGGPPNLRADPAGLLGPAGADPLARRLQLRALPHGEVAERVVVRVDPPRVLHAG